jgi:pimeloyl-ACP methyl ester carboxylesterase
MLLFGASTNCPDRSVYPPPEEMHDSSFWNLTEATSTPVTVNNISTSVEFYQSTSIDEWYFSYDSESLQDNSIGINSVIIKRTNNSQPMPAILFLHGYGSRFSHYLDFMRNLAAMGGFIVMGIDHPGQGSSTGVPNLSALTFLNVTGGPQSANLYHSVMAAVRGVTLLETLSYVNTSAIVASGVSMGAWTSFIVSSIDTRVDGVVSMIMAGNLLNSIELGALVNTVIVPSYTADSTEMQNIVRWFDPIPYVRTLKQPTLMLYGSNDDYYPITSIQDTIAAIDAPLTLHIAPNYGHGVHDDWISLIRKWVNKQFLHGDSLPSISLSTDQYISIQGPTISVRVNATDVTRAWVCWRSSEPGALWHRSLMNRINQGEYASFSLDLVPLMIGKVSYYVVVEQSDQVRVSSTVKTGTAGSILLVILFILSGIILLNAIHLGEWFPREQYVVRELPYVLGIIMLVLGFTLPLAHVHGRATLSVLEIVELFGNSFFLKEWFIPTFVASVSFILALSAYRHQFPFRVAGILWTVILVILLILFVVLSAIFRFFGTRILVSIGIGGPLFLVGIVLMQLLDNTVRKKVENRISQMRENVKKYDARKSQSLSP